MKTDYDMNNKPLVKTSSEKPFNSSTFRQGDKGKAPIVRVPASKSPFGKTLMPENGVSSSSSASLQKASKLPGRASLSGESVDLG